MVIEDYVKECSAGRVWGQRAISRIKYIIVHRNELGHDGPSLASGFRALPSSSGQRKGPPYHYVITADGRIQKCLADSDIGAHAAVPGYNFNRDSIGVCFIGDFTRHAPTIEQVNAAHYLLPFLCQQFKLDPTSAIWRHDELPGVKEYKSCPGKHFPLEDIKKFISSPGFCAIT